MRNALAAAPYLLIGVAACHAPAPESPASIAPPPPTATREHAPPPAPMRETLPPVRLHPRETMTADTPRATTRGNSFVAPAGWSIATRGDVTLVEAPEAGSCIALVDVTAPTADAALAAAWAAYKPDAKWPLKVTSEVPDRDGWSKTRAYTYQTSPNERRDVAATARFANDTWTVAIYDMADDVGEKRLAAVRVVFDRLLPKGYARESFAGKHARHLDRAQIVELGKFIEESQKALGIPGVSVAIVQDGEVVMSGGFGVRDLAAPKVPPNGDTLYMVASNTKALTTLMLAKLVDDKRLTWDTTAMSLLPTFKLGDDDITRRVLVRHLICACTGLPRQDLEWLFQFKGLTPGGAMTTLGTMKPTSKFGEMFQYSNLMAAAAGFVGGHVLFPKLELGAAYDQAMQKLVFEPLGMRATTFDYARALKANHAYPHAPDIENKPARAVMDLNYAAVPVRPAGAAWSSVNDMIKYVKMELDEGVAGGKPYIGKAPLLARRDAQVRIGNDAIYGMGLMVDTTYGVAVVHHGGDLIGFHSDMMWLPEHKVGAVILTNGNPGWVLRDVFRRKLLEVLFDGKPEADARIAAAAKTWFERRAAERKLLTVPADGAEAAKLAARYVSDALGEIVVKHDGAHTTFDFGEWSSEVATRKNPDGSISFVTIRAGGDGFEFVVGKEKERTLVIRDAQHEYVFAAK
jgi:CubicO group peptidase (beta-lactamase class C family)